MKAEGQVKVTKFSRMPSSRNTVFKNGVGPCAVSGDTGAVVSSSLVESLGIISGAVIALENSLREAKRQNQGKYVLGVVNSKSFPLFNVV